MGKKILLADDSITIQKVIELTFSDEDFDVVTVGNGRLALERLPEVRPDIVLCDIIMPEKDGYEVCEQIKSNPASGHIPVLLLTGAFEPFDQDRAAKAGYDGSLAKPFEPETLIAKVKELLAKAPRQAAPPPLPPATRMPSVPSPVAAAPRPVPTPARPASASFIPDEPFSALDERAFPPDRPPSRPTGPPLPAISAEESATLMAGGEAADDTAATVMFRSGGPTWAPPAPSTPPAGRSEAAEPEPMLVADSGEESGGPAFEAVLEEDLDFGPGDFAPEPRADAGGRGGGEGFPVQSTTLPPVARVEEGTSGPFAALVRPDAGKAAADEPSFTDTAAFPRRATVVSEEELLDQPSPSPSIPAEPVLKAEPVAAPAAHGAPKPPAPRSTGAMRTLLDSRPEPPAVRAPQPPAVAAKPAVPTTAPPKPPMSAAVPPKPPSPTGGTPARPLLEPSPARAVETPVAVAPKSRSVASFGDVARPAEEPPAPVRPSEAAEVPVPVEMVEKIAQRVIAQISEKVVREIAWEVIPDLAEALIKREIERLKSELAKS